ncbi:MAG: histidine kinase [bacterium]|nr:histidine kinase [bacterium]
MNKQQWIYTIGSRPALNIYLWILLIVIKFPDADDQPENSRLIFYGLILLNMSFFAALAYIHNFYLQTKFLFKGKKIAYYSSSFLLLVSISYGYVVMLKLLHSWFPLLDTLQTSMVMSQIGDGVSFTEVLADIETYFFTMLVWLVVFGLLGLYHHSKSKLSALQNAINEHREAELIFLKNQINPHFLFNTLNNIYALSLKKDAQTPDLILKLAAVLRYMLYESEGNLVSAEAEKEIMLSFIDIELLRIPETDKMQFTIHTDNEYKIAPLLWLPVLENVFKYTRNVKQPSIHFEFNIHKGILAIKCRNTFIKSAKSLNENIGGIGLANLKKRLALLYPDNFKMEIKEEVDIYDILIKINLEA